MHDTLTIDIETVADPNPPELMEDLMDFSDVKGDGRIKDPDKYEESRIAKIADKRAEYLSKMGLSPLTGKICCFGWMWQYGENPPEQVKSVCSQSEEIVIAKIQEVFSMATQLTTLVTFHGKAFDLPFIKTRCAIMGAPLRHYDRWSSKYEQESHFDVRCALTNFDDYVKGTLGQWATKMGIPYDNNFGGDTIQELYDENQLQIISGKCEVDVFATFSMFQKMRGAFGH